MKLNDLLTKYNACREAQEWCRNKTLADAWETCERGDWMLWLAAKLIDRKTVVLAACACARLALKHVSLGEERPLRAIETAEAWCRDEATIEQVRAAAYDAGADAYAAIAAASAAASAAYAADAADAASAAYAADAASAAAYAADTAYAADAADADAYDAYAAARSEAYRQCADVVRQHIAFEVIEKAAEELRRLRAFEAAMAEKCRNTPGSCFCGMHLSQVMEAHPC